MRQRSSGTKIRGEKKSGGGTEGRRKGAKRERGEERAVEGRGERSRMDGERYPIFRRRDERGERIRKEWAEKRSGTMVWK